jgi:hypothetical protein
MTLEKATTTRLPKILDERGNLSVFENDQYFPFEMKQVSWFWANSASECDTALAHETSGRVIVVLSGTMKIILNHSSLQQEVILDNDNNCLYIPPLVECLIEQCTKNTLAFLASNEICEADDSPTHFLLNKKVINEGYELPG